MALVINDRYQSGRLVHRHAAKLTRLPHLQQSNLRLTEPDFRRLDPYYRYSCQENVDSHKVGYVMDLSLSAILMSSGKELVCIFFITLAPMHFDSGFTGIELCRNLLVKHPGKDQVA
jgi:hypothetical protein